MSLQAHQHGAQYAHTWLTGESDERVIASRTNPEDIRSLTRINVLGDVLLRLQWGTGQVNELVELRAPLLALVPGIYQVFARPRTDDGATVILTAVPVASGVRPTVRQWHDAAGGAIALDLRGAWFVSTAPSTLTVAGVATGAVPVGARVPLVAPSVLITGAGVLEFEV